MSRILVTGKYNTKGEYVLRKESGEIYKTLKEGDSFRIDNQMREWTVIKKGRKLWCEKNGEMVPLYHGKKGLWATSSGAARNGLFHWYMEPKNLVEQALQDIGASTRIVEDVEEIDWTGRVGGELCHHCVNNYGIIAYYDGEEENLTDPPRVKAHSNEYHVGCISGYYKTHITGGTYLIVYNLSTCMNGMKILHPEMVLITPKADLKEVANVLRTATFSPT